MIQRWVVGLLVLGVLAGLLVYELASWSRCLNTGPWWYCLRLLW